MTIRAAPRILLALALAALTAAVCGCQAPGSSSARVSAPAATTTESLPSTPAQVANGPLTTETGPRQPQAPPASTAPPATGPALRVRLEGPDPVVIHFKKPPRAGLVVDLDTGQILWRRNAQRASPIASVTKMMTALLVAERLPPGSTIKITREATHQQGSKVGTLIVGRRVGVSGLLHGLLLTSGNDAATALAIRISGSQRAFVRLMNERARQLGLTCTRFASPSGIVDAGNYSCPVDLAVLARAVLDAPRLARVVRTRKVTIPAPVKGGRLELYTHNPLLRSRYPGTLGIKTGYTNAAGLCFVGAAERKGRRFAVILLDSPNPGRQARQLLDRAFALVPTPPPSTG